MSFRPFAAHSFLTDCPPDYETIVGWFARNDPHILEDLFGQAGGDTDELLRMLEPETRAVMAKVGEDFLYVTAPDAMRTLFVEAVEAFPVGVLNEVLPGPVYV